MLEKVAEEPTLKTCSAVLEKARSYDEIRKLFDFASKLRDDNAGRTLKLDLRSSVGQLNSLKDVE